MIKTEFDAAVIDSEKKQEDYCSSNSNLSQSRTRNRIQLYTCHKYRATKCSLHPSRSALENKYITNVHIVYAGYARL